MTQANPDPLAFAQTLAVELGLPRRGVESALRLLAEGNTVPFIARYRKEATGDLDEVQLRDIDERQAYLAELHARRLAILQSVESQGLLTDALRARLLACTTKAELEDLYLPFKPKRRTKATIARERGLEPLAERMLAQPREGDPLAEAARFVSPEKEVPDVDAALQGARHIVAEQVAERAEVRALAREAFRQDGVLRSEVAPDAAAGRTRFEQYYDFAEPVRKIPSHRFLAVRRGEREGVLRVHVEVDAERLLPRVERLAGVVPASPFAGHLRDAIRDAWRRMLAPSVETDVRVDLKQEADREAVEVFARNLRELLLASPLGGAPVVAVDPGLRTGCKCVALDATGAFLEHITVYPHTGGGRATEAAAAFAAFVARSKPRAVAIGNGTGGRETERFAREALRAAGQADVMVVLVNESGASIYSASDVAREEFPDLDLTLRGAISIGRRLQDPLAELVKIDPKSIGVGQYQHDVHQPLLQRKLDEVVESCVNHVGVELNTASASLLTRVAGIGPTLARRVVSHRTEHGRFGRRAELLKVAGLGPKTFEQCAGFLRIRDGAHPLDASAVHPERYALVERIAADLGVPLSSLVGNAALASKIDVARYLDASLGEPTLRDIIAELERPGRDPRSEFEPPRFREDVSEIGDLRPGMTLEGVVTNVTAFGAFVDLGVHQDGLVHISQLSDRFVRDPSEVVAPGDRLTVRVLDVDLERKRISLTAKREVAPSEAAPGPSNPAPARRDPPAARSQRPKATPQGREQKPDGGFRHNPFAGLRRP